MTYFELLISENKMTEQELDILTEIMEKTDLYKTKDPKEAFSIYWKEKLN